MIRLTNLPMPVSKNRLHQPIRCGRFTKMVRSKAARLRGQEIVAAIWKQLGGRLHDPAITKPCSMVWDITFPDKRKRDLANFVEHLQDLLQEARVIDDDSLIVHQVGEVMPSIVKPGFVNVTLEEIP